MSIDHSLGHFQECRAFRVGNYNVFNASVDRTVNHIEHRIHQLIPEADIGGNQHVEATPGSDAAVNLDGYISVTPMRADLTARDAMDALKAIE